MVSIRTNFFVQSFASHLRAYVIYQTLPSKYVVTALKDVVDIEPLDCIALKNNKYVRPKWKILGLD